MGKSIKKILYAFGVLICFVLTAAILIPILFKDKIMLAVKQTANEQLIAKVDFQEVNISILRHFPKLTIGIEQISVANVAPFAGDTLLAAKNVEVSVDIMKALKGTYEILNIEINEPRIHAIIAENGQTNWDITKPDTTTTSSEPSTPFSFQIQKYAITHGYIVYHDYQGNMHSILTDLNHSGSGDFSSDLFTLKTKTEIGGLTYSMGNIPYLSNVTTSADFDIEVDNKQSKYSFNTDKIKLNGLALSTKGFVQMPDTSKMVMDIQFATPSNDFKDILSLVPGMFTKDFKDVKTTGKLALNGVVKGTYSAQSMPAFHVQLQVDNGSFQYPALPQKVTDIQINLLVDNPDGNMDHTVVHLSKGHLKLGNNPFDATILLKTPISNQWINASLNGRIDLSEMQQLVKLEAGTQMKGLIMADVAVKGYVTAMQKQQFQDVDAKGTIQIQDLLYIAKDYPDGVSVTSLLLTFNPKNVTVSNLKGQYLSTNFTGEGAVDNLLGYYLHNESLAGNMHFTADKVDLNKFMGTETTPATATVSDTNAIPFVVPKNMEINIKAEVNSIKYDKVLLTNVAGNMNIHNQTVALQNVVCNGLDGVIKMNGTYSTLVDKRNPDIQFNYDVLGIDVNKTYQSFDFVQKMMPAGKYINGKMSSKLAMKGKLYGDMSVKMRELSGKGDLMMLQGNLSNFPVTEQLANQLNLSQLKSFPLKDMKLFYAFENGRMVVEPFKMNINQIPAEIAGSHGMDQSIAYGVNLMVPRTMMGNQGNAVINDLVKKANAKGVPVNVGDQIPITVNITGSITKPKIETNLKNIAGNAVDNVKKELEAAAKRKLDSVKNVVKDTVKAVKQQLINTAKDEVKKQIFGGNSGDTTKKNEAIKEVGDKVKDGLKGLFNKRKKDQ